MRRGILASIDELNRIRGRIEKKPFDAIYDSLHKRCSLILEAAPVAEAQWRAMWEQGVWGSALLAARTTQGRILDLLVAHHIDPNPAYRDRAIEELKNLIGWSTWVDPCHNHIPADLCTAEAAVAAVVGLDWLWEDLRQADRLRVLRAIRDKALVPYRQAVKQGVFWYNCYHNWNAVVNSGCGLAALALGDEEPSAQKAYKESREGLKRFFSALGREGGWDEGTGYWGYAMRYVLLFGHAVSRLLDDQTILHSRGMEMTGLFGIHFTPNGQAASFGDAASVPLHGTFYLLDQYFGLKDITWWLDTYSFHRDVSTTGYSAAGLALLLRPDEGERPTTSHLKPVKVFNEIGWAAMADHWPRPEFYVAVRSGDLSANHSQRDMNSFQLQVDGEMLLTDLGHPPYSQEYFSDRRESFYDVQAKAHNTIVVAGRDHQIDAKGSIVEAQSGRNHRWIACDATSACGDTVHFIRHLIMIVNPAGKKGEALIVLDELRNTVAEKVDMYLHTLAKMQFDAARMSGSIVGRQAGLNFSLACSADVKAAVESRQVSRDRTDHALRISTPAVGKVLLASIFSREQLPRIQLTETSHGGVRLKSGRLDLHFKGLKRYLSLEKVVGP